jgi:VanZ family protein
MVLGVTTLMKKKIKNMLFLCADIIAINLSFIIAFAIRFDGNITGKLDSETSTTADLVAKFNHVVRKFGHFGIYFTLGILVLNALTVSGVRGFKGFIFSLVFCILYAISDEVHQLFVLGRGAQVVDVLIDSLGAFVGIGMYRVIG